MDIVQKKDLILKLLKIAIQKDELSAYMRLRPDYTVESCDPNSNERCGLDYYSWEALYVYANQNPKENIGEIITDALNCNASYKGERVILSVISFLEYYCEYLKKNKTSPFSIDVQFILDTLAHSILDNKDMYTSKKECFNEPFWNYIEKHNEYLKKEFGYRLI